MTELFELACSSVKSREAFITVAGRPIHHWGVFEHLFKTNYPNERPEDFVLKYRYRLIEFILDELGEIDAPRVSVFRHTGDFTLETFKSGDILLKAIARYHLPDNEAVKWTPKKLLYCDKKCLTDAVNKLFVELPKIKIVEETYLETDIDVIIKMYIYYYELFKTVELVPIITKSDLAFDERRPCIWVKDDETLCYVTKSDIIFCDCVMDLLQCTVIPPR